MKVVNDNKAINYGQIVKILRRKLVVIPSLGNYRTNICIESLSWYTSYLMVKLPSLSIEQIRNLIAEEILNMELSLEKIQELQIKVKQGVAV